MFGTQRSEFGSLEYPVICHMTNRLSTVLEKENIETGNNNDWRAKLLVKFIVSLLHCQRHPER